MIVTAEQFEFDRDKTHEIKELTHDHALTQDQRKLIDELGIDQPFITHAPSYCFFCGRKLTIPAVMWHGHDGERAGDTVELWLHPKCANQLVARISRDINELEIGRKLADEQLEKWKRDHPT